jgi:hypothetical protein
MRGDMRKLYEISGKIIFKGKERERCTQLLNPP